MLLFVMIFKTLKFMRNVPIMKNITDTFADVSLTISIFFVVMIVIFLAFAMLFNLTFSLSMPGFDNLGNSLFSIFLAMTGNIDVATMKMAHPVWGPLFYCVFNTVVVFVGFTILIAIVSDSYESVKDVAP